MTQNIEKIVWATAELIEAFNTDQTDETREAIFTEGVKCLKQYAFETEYEIENMELVNWEVAFRICKDWIELELWRTATSGHVREYMSVDKQTEVAIPQKMSGTGSIYDLECEHCDRVVKFPVGKNFAIVTASHYNCEPEFFSSLDSAMNALITSDCSGEVIEKDGSRFTSAGYVGQFKYPEPRACGH